LAVVVEMDGKKSTNVCQIQDRPQQEYAYLRERLISSVRMIASAISRMAFRFCRLCFCNAR